TIVGYKHTWMLEKRTSMNVSFKIFCGWDFNIQDPAAAKLKHSFIRNDLKEKYPTSLLARLTGKQRFLIPFNVLDLVYIQTVSWVGVYYCPLVLRCCVAEQRMFRASNSSVLFYFMLLLGLLMAATTPVLDFYQSKQANKYTCFVGSHGGCHKSYVDRIT
ncbi:hypothetical protein XENOCAPTIV_003726, partial [Xenoophorus captivus]